MHVQKFCRMLPVLFYLPSNILAQTVSVQLETESTTGYQVAGSTVKAAVGLVDNNSVFTMVWRINTTDVASCQPVGGGDCVCRPETATELENRTMASCTGSTFFLHFTTTASDQQTSIHVFNGVGENLESVSFVVTPYCVFCPEFVNCSDTNCGLGCSTALECRPGYTGTVTAVCQDDASFAETGVCSPVQCNTMAAPCGGCNAADTEVDFNTTLKCLCGGNQYEAYCDVTGTWNITSEPVLCNTNDITCDWCQISENQDLEYNTTLDFSNCQGGKGSAQCLATGEWNVTCTAQCNTSYISCEWCEVPENEIHDSNYLLELLSCEKGATGSAKCLNTGDWNVTCTAQCNASDILPCERCEPENVTINYNETYTRTCSDETISSKCLAAGEWENSTCKKHDNENKGSGPLVKEIVIPIACVGVVALLGAGGIKWYNNRPDNNGTGGNGHGNNGTGGNMPGNNPMGITETNLENPAPAMPGGTEIIELQKTNDVI